MKKMFLTACLEAIKKNDTTIDNDKLNEIRYGLESLYLMLTKTIVIFTVSYFLGLFKEMLIMLVVFNILRSTGFGIHAKKSWQCWISSLILFILFPYISNMISLNLSLKIILGIFSIIMFFLYAPADTVKHPLVNKKKRLIWRVITVLNSILLVSIAIFTKDNGLSNLVLFGIYSEVVLILPITYKIFNLPYNNYLKYGLSSNV